MLFFHTSFLAEPSQAKTDRRAESSAASKFLLKKKIKKINK